MQEILDSCTKFQVRLAVTSSKSRPTLMPKTFLCSTVPSQRFFGGSAYHVHHSYCARCLGRNSTGTWGYESSTTLCIQTVRMNATESGQGLRNGESDGYEEILYKQLETLSMLQVVSRSLCIQSVRHEGVVLFGVAWRHLWFSSRWVWLHKYYCCFLYLWGSRKRDEHYSRKDWTTLAMNDPGTKNFVEFSHFVIIPLLYIKMGIF